MSKNRVNGTRDPRPRCTIGPRVSSDLRTKRYVRRVKDPATRPLRVFTSDPTASVHDGRVATIQVPYEEVEPGPVGSLLEVVDQDDSARQTWAPVDLDEPSVLLHNGLKPTVSDPRFHQQMVYAVASSVYQAFRLALGRSPSWSFATGGSDPVRLRIRPHAREEANAWFDQARGELCFGYFRGGPNPVGRRLPNGMVYTCLSHDIVTHEMTHALLDGLRPHFIWPSGPDVLAFHEGFADVIVVFQKFTYEDVVRTIIKRTRGDLSGRTALSDIAAEFGDAVGRGCALRSAVDVIKQGGPAPDRGYNPSLPPHRLGAVLLGGNVQCLSVRLPSQGGRVLSTGRQNPRRPGRKATAP